MLAEKHQPGEAPEFEKLPVDMAGYVIQGGVMLEVEGEDSQVLYTGDAFYLPAARSARGRCATENPVQLLTVFTQPGY